MENKNKIKNIGLITELIEHKYYKFNRDINIGKFEYLIFIFEKYKQAKSEIIDIKASIIKDGFDDIETFNIIFGMTYARYELYDRQ